MSYRIHQYLFNRKKGDVIYLTIEDKGIRLEQSPDEVFVGLSELQGFIDLLTEVTSVVGVKKKKEKKENIFKKIMEKIKSKIK